MLNNHNCIDHTFKYSCSKSFKTHDFLIQFPHLNSFYNSSIMRSSSSSRFDKDSYSTQGFESQLGEANFEFAQSIDQFDLEQSCLLRLKAQRQKIEQLTKLYQDNERQLVRKTEKEKAMLAEIEQLMEMAVFKGEWESLKRQHDSLLKRHQAAEGELATLRRNFQGITNSNCDETEQLRKEIKYLKEQRLLSDAHWEAILSDKEEQLKKEGRTAQERQYELCQKIQILSEKIETLQQTLSERQQQFESKGSQFRDELTVRQQDLLAFQKIVQSFKKQNSEYKAKIISIQDAFEKEKCQYLQAIDQLKAQIKIFRKDKAQKQNEIYEFKEIIKKCDNKNQALESTVTSLKTNLKKFKVNTDSSFKKMATISEEERTKLELFIHELKTELEKQMQENASLFAEVKRLKGHLERKDQQEKQRKLLLMTQFREIDKMEKLVKKII